MFPVLRASTAIVASALLTLSAVVQNYEPPDVGGPTSTQGSGTRYTAQPLHTL